jgi:uncharacterized protein (DUF2252 family)
VDQQPGERRTAYGIDPEQLESAILRAFSEYRLSLQPDRRKLLEIVDWARKVVGVGSVGTRAFVALLEGRDHGDPLFLQIKEATSSVLEGPPAEEQLPPGRRACRARTTTDAGVQ